MIALRLLLLTLAGVTPAVAADLSELTRLAESAAAGPSPLVPGFDVRVLRHGQPIYHRAFGDWQIDQPAQADSSTKTLSGMLMMAVADATPGFSLDSRLADHLPAYDRPGYRDVTVRQAFSHTAGFGDSTANRLALAAPDLTLRQAAAIIANHPLTHGPPGTAFAYGGASMHAAGAAAEAATGRAFVDLLDEHLTGPLEMTDTRLTIASDTNPRVAGGAQSTATDFARLMDVLLTDGVDRASGRRILSADSVTEMLTRQTRDDQPIVSSPTDNSRYGVGVWLDQLGGELLGDATPPVDALAGGARGFHAWVDHSEGLVFVMATDRSRFADVQLLSAQMHRAILTAVPEPSAAATLLVALAAATRRRETTPRSPWRRAAC